MWTTWTSGSSGARSREHALGAGRVEAILHQGACSNTLEDDGVYMMDNNFQYTKEVLAFAIRWRALRWCMRRLRRCMGCRARGTLRRRWRTSGR